jgi:hypothetical protein
MNTENNKLILNGIESHRVFLFTLEWLLALMARYSSTLPFDLVYIKLGNNHELGETFGALEALNQLSSFTSSLTSAFRKTDLVTRDFTDFWVIAPYTADSEKINDKILGVIQEATHHCLNVVDLEISIFEFPLTSIEALNIPTSAIEFLEYLKENKQQFASHVFRLSANELGQI